MSFWATRDKPPKKKRIAFDVEAETLEQIDDLMEKTACVTRAELFRDSLRLLMWWTEKQDDGYEVVLKKDGEEFAVELARVP
jgi:metal-responsive CopG/Arc/MetJ family transcriptional regulator